MNKIMQKSICASVMAFAVATTAQAEVGPLLWQENFDSLDSDIWNIDVGDGCDQGLCGWGNQELQWYHPDNVSIATIPGEGNNKALILTAKNQAVSGRAFTSGKVTTKNKLAVQYGMIEVRMKDPVVDKIVSENREYDGEVIVTFSATLKTGNNAKEVTQ